MRFYESMNFAATLHRRLALSSLIDEEEKKKKNCWLLIIQVHRLNVMNI